jgi:hypothetical protein
MSVNPEVFKVVGRWCCRSKTGLSVVEIHFYGSREGGMAPGTGATPVRTGSWALECWLFLERAWHTKMNSISARTCFCRLCGFPKRLGLADEFFVERDLSTTLTNGKIEGNDPCCRLLIFKGIGRHERIRTADLFRVKVCGNL